MVRLLFGNLLAVFVLSLSAGYSYGQDNNLLRAEYHKKEWQKAWRDVWGYGNVPALAAMQVEQESGWVDGRLSSANARGICQFIEPTAVGIETQYNDLIALGRYSVKWCYRAQALLMKDLYDSYIKQGYSPCSAFLMALSAYNGGPSMLKQEQQLCQVDDDCNHYLWFLNVEPQRKSRAYKYWVENREYVWKIFKREKVYADADWGIMVCQ